jgi:hypothetical protein
MEKLDKKIVDYIQSVIKTCSLCNIDQVSIESNIVRGQAIDSGKNIILFTENDIPTNLPFAALGIGRVKVFSSRVSVLNPDELEISFESKDMDNGDKVAKKLLLKSKRTKFDFSCTSPTQIKAPKKYGDTPGYIFKVGEETLRVITKASAAMEMKKISFSNDKDGSVRFVAADDEGDMLNHTIATSYEVGKDVDSENFFYSYDTKDILPLFKTALGNNDHVEVSISRQRGIMEFNINNMRLLVIPEK